MVVEIVLTMLAMGLILGFVGAGGSGFIIAILTTIFGFPIHTAFGTSLAAMVFTTLSGTFSHFREGNVVIKVGAVVGGFSAIGAFIGSRFATYIPAHDLNWLTAGMLLLSGIILWVRMFIVARRQASYKGTFERKSGVRFWLLSAGIGIVTGVLSGTFGIGSTPFIQLGLMMILGLPVRLATGTTMMVILPTAISGGISYYSIGYLNIPLLLEVVVGTMVGSYIGAKFTKRVPLPILKTAMVAVPMIASFLLIV